MKYTNSKWWRQAGRHSRHIHPYDAKGLGCCSLFSENGAVYSSHLPFGRKQFKESGFRNSRGPLKRCRRSSDRECQHARKFSSWTVWHQVAAGCILLWACKLHRPGGARQWWIKNIPQQLPCRYSTKPCTCTSHQSEHIDLRALILCVYKQNKAV